MNCHYGLKPSVDQKAGQQIVRQVCLPPLDGHGVVLCFDALWDRAGEWVVESMWTPTEMEAAMRLNPAPTPPPD